MSISRQCRSRIPIQSFGSAHLGVKKSRCFRSLFINRGKSLTLAAATEITRSHEATSKDIKKLAGNSESHPEDRNITYNAIHKDQEREFCNNCGKANYWQSVCRSSKRKQFNQGRKPTFKQDAYLCELGLLFWHIQL